eukprot:Gb_17234 [translate_table: standard]
METLGWEESHCDEECRRMKNIDIHPTATLGKGLLFDHAMGVVLGEIANNGDNVFILHHVTLDRTGKIGEGAKIGAGSVILIEVPPHTTAVGVMLGGPICKRPNNALLKSDKLELKMWTYEVSKVIGAREIPKVNGIGHRAIKLSHPRMKLVLVKDEARELRAVDEDTKRTREWTYERSREQESRKWQRVADKAEKARDNTAKQRHTKEQSWNERHTDYREGDKILKTPLKIVP